jgi:PhnB protein
MQIRPNLNFAGNAADVIKHYQAALGGDVQVIHSAGSPAADFVPPEWGDKILFATLSTPYGEIEVMDAPPGREGGLDGNVAVSMDVDDEEKAGQIFAKLAVGGNVMMPFAETFFARKFGMTSDKFGVRWMVKVPLAAPVHA